MNLILFGKQDACFSSSDPGQGRVTLRGRQLRHLLDVHGAVAGDILRVGLLNGRQGSGLVRHIDEQIAHLDFTLDADPPPALPVTLIVALPRPKMLRRIFQATSSLGVKHLIVINSARVEKSYWQTPHLDEASIREDLWLGLEQGRDTVMPTVELRKRFRPFVEDELPGLLEGKHGLVAHPHEGAAACPRHIEGSAVLAIGPEGGFVPFEIDRLEAAGMKAVSLGPRILRVDTAVTWLLGRLY